MIYVPDKFKPKHPFPYPADNHYEFERWYHDHYSWEPEAREYLPIFWTAYYCRHKFGKDERAMVDLQKFLDRLDRSKQYYTIVQYDGGILHNIAHLDIMVLSMSGGRTDYPLPLISWRHDDIPYSNSRPWFGNFVGAVTHPIREVLLNHLPRNGKWVVNTKKHSINAFCAIVANSVFTLCPRGYGPTSFRIQEAMQYGSIPVYISDEFVIPHNLPFNDYGVGIHARDARHVADILSDIPAHEIRRRQEAIPEIYNKYFTYEGNKKAIKEAIAKYGRAVGNIPI